MGWFDDLENSIHSVIVSHQCPKNSERHSKITREELLKLFNTLSRQVATGSDAQAAFTDIDVHLTHYDIGRLLERKSFTCENPESMEAYLTFIITYRLLTNRDILAEMFVASDFKLVPETLKIQVLELLSNRILNLDDVLNAISQLKLEEICLPLMLNVQYDGGQVVLYSKLSKMSARIPGLYQKLMPLLMEKISDPKNLVIWAMDYPAARMQTVLDALIPELTGKEFVSLGDIAIAVFKNRASYLKKFIISIFKGDIIEWNYENLKELAATPLKQFRDDLGMAAQMFTEFSGIVLLLGSKKGFEPLFKAWVGWLYESIPESKNYVSADSARQHFKVSGKTDIFTPVALVATAFEKFLKKRKI